MPQSRAQERRDHFGGRPQSRAAEAAGRRRREDRVGRRDRRPVPHDLPVAAGRQGSGGGVPGTGRPRLEGDARLHDHRHQHCAGVARPPALCRVRGQGLRLRRFADRAHAAGGDRRHAVDHGRRHEGNLCAHRAVAAASRERGHALRRGGRGAGGQDPEQHDPVPDRGRAGRGAVHRQGQRRRRQDPVRHADQGLGRFPSRCATTA